MEQNTLTFTMLEECKNGLDKGEFISVIFMDL